MLLTWLGWGGVERSYSKLELKYPKVLKKVLLKVLMKSKVLKSSISQGNGTGPGPARSEGDPPGPGQSPPGVP